MKRIIASLLGLGLLGLGGLATAGPGGVPPAMMKKVMKERVGLTDAQIDQIHALQYQADREKLDIQHELQKARLDLEQLMRSDRPDRAKVFAQLDRLGQFETNLKKNRVGLMLEIRKAVTPEQWQKMEELHAEKKMQRRQHRRQRRFEGPGGPLAPDAPEPPGEDLE